MKNSNRAGRLHNIADALQADQRPVSESQQFFSLNNSQAWFTIIFVSRPSRLTFMWLTYRGADKSLARPTSRCILFDAQNISFDTSLVIYIYIYIYRVSQEERTKLREGVPYVKLYRYNPKHLYPKLNGYGDNGKRSLKL